jgi:4-hydroxy-3-methylbut-2-enyl diphosphate reductase IspH
VLVEVSFPWSSVCSATSSLGVALVALSVTNPSVVVVGNNSSSTGTLLVSLVKFCSAVSVTFKASDKVTFCCAYTFPLTENIADTSTKDTKSDIFAANERQG